MFEKALVRDWMSSPALTVTQKTPIAEAHKLMKDNGVRRLIVVQGETPVGIITIGDVREASPSDAVTLSIWELNHLWAQLTVGKVMTRRILTVTPETLVLDAAELMLEHKISGLPVIVGNKLVGVITESDIFRMLVRSRQAAQPET